MLREAHFCEGRNRLLVTSLLTLSLQGTMFIIPNPSSPFSGFNITIKTLFWASQVSSGCFIYSYMDVYSSVARLDFQSTDLPSDLQSSMHPYSMQHQMSLDLFKAYPQSELPPLPLIFHCLSVLAFCKDHSVNLTECQVTIKCTDEQSDLAVSTTPWSENEMGMLQWRSGSASS